MFVSVLIGLLALSLLCSTVQTVRNVCSNNRHRTGVWKHREHHTNDRKSFHCCGILEDEFLENTTVCGAEKLDLHIQFGSTKHLAHVTGHGCQCDAREGRDSINSRERYEWVPEFCYLLPWNATQFCELLGNRTIMFVGDSTMQQTVTTVMSMLNVGGGQCGPQIISARSFYLFFATNDSLDMFTYINRYKPDICIMGSGAHISSTGDMHSVLENVKNKMPELRKWSPRTKYVWKTLNPGHTYCKNYSKPLMIPDINQTAYNYRLFPAYDKAGYEYADKWGWKVLDMSPLYLRPDAHADCMHYCVPGPVDMVSNILLTMLYNGEV